MEISAPFRETFWPVVAGKFALSSFNTLLAGTVTIAAASALTGDPVVVWFIGFGAAIGVAAASVPVEARLPHWSLRGMWVMIACLALMLSCIIHQSPFRARFALARNAIDKLVQRAERGEMVETPCWAGSFLIQQVEIPSLRRGSVTGNGRLPPDAAQRIFLWTSLDPIGRIGFARGIEANEARFFTQYRISDQWWFVVED